jgi:peptide/nickel transport system permease protein
MSEPAHSARSRAWNRLRGSRTAWISGAVIAFLLLTGAFGPSLLHDAYASQISGDVLGRSTLTQLVYGVRTSLAVGLISALSTTLIGLFIGAVAGYFGGWFDTLLMRMSEVFQVMPTFILAAVVVALAGPGFGRVIAVIALLSWPQAARLTRGEVIRLRSLEYVDAVRCLGVGEWSILWREVIPNAVSPVFALGTLIIGQAILLEAGLAFFGLTTPDVPSWGTMLNTGQRLFYQAWWLSVFPGLAILVTVLAFNLFGDSLSAAFNPRTATRT